MLKYTNKSISMSPIPPAKPSNPSIRFIRFIIATNQTTVINKPKIFSSMKIEVNGIPTRSIDKPLAYASKANST